MAVDCDRLQYVGSCLLPFFFLLATAAIIFGQSGLLDRKKFNDRIQSGECSAELLGNITIGEKTTTLTTALHWKNTSRSGIVRFSCSLGNSVCFERLQTIEATKIAPCFLRPDGVVLFPNREKSFKGCAIGLCLLAVVCLLPAIVCCFTTKSYRDYCCCRRRPGSRSDPDCYGRRPRARSERNLSEISIT